MKDLLSETKREEVLVPLKTLGRPGEAGRVEELEVEELDNFRCYLVGLNMLINDSRRLIQGISVIGRIVSSSVRVKFLQLRTFSRLVQPSLLSRLFI